MIDLAPDSSARASNLAFALRVLPATRRSDALTFFRFCRAVDDAADDPLLAAPDRREILEEWLDAVRGGLLPGGLEDVVQRHAVPRHLLEEIIHGCIMDTGPVRFRTLTDLERYCWRVACAVGLVSVRIFGCTDPASLSYAENLGHALQITNILRDVAEDARAGRIYLPLEDLGRYGVTEEELLEARPAGGFRKLMAFEAGRARARFHAAVPPESDRRALLPAEVMRGFYARILVRLERAGFPVFQRRIGLGKMEKVAIAAGVLLRCR